MSQSTGIGQNGSSLYIRNANPPVIYLSDSDSGSSTDFSPPVSPSGSQKQNPLKRRKIKKTRTTRSIPTAGTTAITPRLKRQIGKPLVAQGTAKTPQNATSRNFLATTASPIALSLPPISYAWVPDPRLKPLSLQTQCPEPVDWEADISDTKLSQRPFETSPIHKSTKEYGVVLEFLGPEVGPLVEEIKRIRNPKLWDKFKEIRNKYICSKSGNSIVLQELGMSENDVNTQLASTRYSEENYLFPPYMDNVALLFHCSSGNLDDIMTQGLDERLSNRNGLLGRGIYFADDPAKSIQYDQNGQIIIFAVLLGDCLNIQDLSVKDQMEILREPLKHIWEQRTSTDLFFDSVFGRPKDTNEFVIYNGDHCCPLYMVKYKRGTVPVQLAINATETDSNTVARKSVPPFVWIRNIPGRECGKNPSEGWPFFAQHIFQLMTPPTSEEDYSDLNNEQVETAKSIVKFVGNKINGIKEAIRVLRIHNFNRVNALNHIIIAKKELAASSTILPRTKSVLSEQEEEERESRRLEEERKKMHHLTNIIDSVGRGIDYEVADSEGPVAVEWKCKVCWEDFEEKSSRLKILPCRHGLCETCYKQLANTKTTMSGEQFDYIRCPYCKTCSGIEIGDCPNGIMSIKVISTDCESYEGKGTIRVRYIVLEDYLLDRETFLPNNEEGRQVLRLLKKAWDRRLTFMIGTSFTTGQENTLVWKIHQKTSQRFGPYGYPDPDYFNRLRAELTQYEIV